MVWLVIDPGRLTPFVRNRIVQIEESNIGASWKHVQSCESPADVISRGCEPRQLLANTLWWHGPDFLRTSDIPDGSFQVPEVLPDIRTETKSVVVAHVLTSGKGNFFEEGVENRKPDPAASSITAVPFKERRLTSRTPIRRWRREMTSYSGQRRDQPQTGRRRYDHVFPRHVYVESHLRPFPWA